MELDALSCFVGVVVGAISMGLVWVCSALSHVNWD